MQHNRGLVTLLFTIVFSLITPHEKKEGERLTLFSLWATKEKEQKTQICQAGVMTKTMRSGTPPVSSDTGRSTLIKSSVHQAI